MSSAFTWLDHSEADRRKMQRVIDLFQEADTRDELGIGQIRDVFSDILFPGTSTIQTRARYLLFIPWVFMELERQRVPSRRARSRGRDLEVSLIDALVAGGESSGVIGIVARSSVKRLASSVYWHGLGVFGIRQVHGSIEDYYRSLDSFYRVRKATLMSESGEVLQKEPRNWHRGLPEAPHHLLESTTMSLTRIEADYLRDRMRITVAESMLSHMIEMGIETKVGFPWDYPSINLLPATVQEQLLHARNFAQAIHGAALLYNAMLSEQAERDDLLHMYKSALRDWSTDIITSDSRLADWNRSRFWEIVRDANRGIATPTQTFIDRWLDIALSKPDKVAVDPDARALIEHRERTLKHSQARLANRRALEMWNEASGASMLNYRWPVAQTIVNDIIRGLKEPPDA